MGDVREGRKNWAGGMSGRERGGEGGRRVEGEKGEILRGRGLEKGKEEEDRLICLSKVSRGRERGMILIDYFILC